MMQILNVFCNKNGNSDVSIFSPTREIPFAGHALVGVAYYLSKELGKDIKQIKSMGKTIQAFQKDY